MAQKKQTYLDALGPMLWTRFLLHRLQCDLASLNAQLPQPVGLAEHKGFVLGVRPAPDARISDMFGRIHALGKNPNGAYFTEPYSAGAKFNLFERVLLRVPESRYWLLEEAETYISGQPRVDDSASVVRTLLSGRSEVWLSAECVHAWSEHDLPGLSQAQEATLERLVAEASAEALTLLLSLLHLAVWHRAGEDDAPLRSAGVDALAAACQRCAVAIGHLAWLRASVRGPELAEDLEVAVHGAVRWLRQDGYRSASADQGLRRFPALLVLIPDTTDNQRNMLALSLHSSLYGFEPMLDFATYPTLSQDWNAVRDVLAAQAVTRGGTVLPAA
ncbi:hypothetical protein [Lysobacter sp. Root983]|uniref:hypothetical protein n=1 Tax=Lysobacter sp. Root983 TaxID=1736613 RepID=UPI00070D1B3A|nr:hypothetical protein [Lysobacter sp. Root983]KRD79743.1 hypothetical protein ASE43_02250 [Lysobacter sp. Root983]